MSGQNDQEPVDLDPDLDLWEQQPRETSRAFEAFATYRDAGAQRSVRSTARAVGKSARLLARWSHRWRWLERARAWDLRQDAQRREDAVKALADMHDRHARIAAAMTGKLVLRLNSIKPEDLTPGQMAQWLDIAVKIERVARGDVSDRAGLEHSGPGGDAISMQVAEFQRMDPEQRRAAVAKLAEQVRRRALAAAGDDDGDGEGSELGPDEGL